MSGARNPDRVAAALRCLRDCNQYFQFDDQERVVEVAVYRATSADEIAAHVGNLRDVQKLTFDRTDISNDGLAALADLVEVRDFSLQSPNISSAGLFHLANMTRIQKLVLDSPRIGHRELEAVSRLRSLTKLAIYGGAYCDADAARLAELTLLEELETAENERVTGTYVRFMPAHGNLKNLAPGDFVTDEGVSCIAHLSSLKTLFLAGHFSDTGLRQIRTLQSLESLFITSDRVTDAGVAVVAELPTLAWLSLRTPRFTDAGALIMPRCRTLRYLGVFKSALTDVGRKMLRDTMPDCDLQLLDNRPPEDDEE